MILLTKFNYIMLYETISGTRYSSSILQHSYMLLYSNESSDKYCVIIGELLK